MIISYGKFSKDYPGKMKNIIDIRLEPNFNRGLPYQSDKIQTELIKSPVLKQIFWKRGGFGKLCMFLENL